MNHVRNDIRNVAIIAHVDHGKTTLVDALLRQSGNFRDNQVQDTMLDSNPLERERGITILAKNVAINYLDPVSKQTIKINLIDTPGHADFGGEVERVLSMADGVFLLVDAAEGAMPQTRFVLKKAFQHELRPIVVINKIDRPLADPMKVHDQVLELFLDLDATEDQFNAPFSYGSARDGYFMDKPTDEKVDCIPLLKKIVEFIPEPKADPAAPFSMLVSNIEWDNFVGRVAVGKVLGGSVKKGDDIWLIRKDGSKVKSKAHNHPAAQNCRGLCALNPCSTPGSGSAPMTRSPCSPARPSSAKALKPRSSRSPRKSSMFPLLR